jgi:broad-specificity NMP kinase
MVSEVRLIVIINGTLGVGKTEASWGLMRRFDRAVMLDGDYIAAFHPQDYYNQAHLEYACETFRVLAVHHQGHGIDNIVINWVFESPASLLRLRQALSGVGLPIHAFRLSCDPDVIAERIRRRNLPDVEWELRLSRQLAGIMEKAALDGDLGIEIDTTRLNVEQMVERIWLLLS